MTLFIVIGFPRKEIPRTKNIAIWSLLKLFILEETDKKPSARKRAPSY